MPIEIKELHIKTIVGDGKTTETGTNEENQVNNKELKSKIIAECVEQIMEILKDRNER